MQLPAGEYFVGDPCYFVVSKDWDKFLDSVIKYELKFKTVQEIIADGEDISGIVKPEEYKGFPYTKAEYIKDPTFKRKKVFVHETKHGDGVFTDQHDEIMFPVDSGIIGAVPLNIYHNKNKRRSNKIFNFKSSFNCEYKNGIFYIGDLIINTN